MCYRIITHTLRCDVRPTISVKIDLVDPLAEPARCNCSANNEVKPWLRCDEHGCCMITAKMAWCPDSENCTVTLDYHRYHQAPCNVRSSWNAGGPGLPDLHATFDVTDPKWERLLAFDELFFDGANLQFNPSPPLYVTALDSMIIAGRLIQETKVTLASLKRETGAMTREHHDECGEACEWVLNEWECRSITPIDARRKLMSLFTELLQVETDLFDASWKLLQASLRLETGESKAKVEEHELFPIRELEVVEAKESEPITRNDESKQSQGKF